MYTGIVYRMDEAVTSSVTSSSETTAQKILFISKDEINRLPITSYSGAIHLVANHQYLTEAVQALRDERVLGFDTETRPSFTRDSSYPTSLIQLAGTDAVYLFQLNRLGRLGALTELLADQTLIKAGVALDADVRKLQEIEAFTPGGFVDLAAMSDSCGIGNNGLRGLTAACMGIRISKRAQRSNWGRQRLSPSQIKYAATDAWASRQIYLALARLQEV